MTDHLDRAAAILGGCCAHCDDLLDERLALLDEAGLLVTPERDAVRYVVFHSDWREPPGDVIAVFATEEEARAHIDGPGDGCGWTVVEVPAP